MASTAIAGDVSCRASPRGQTLPKTFDKPSEVSSDDGHVHIHGPDGIDVAMTPAAAFETAQRLDAAAIDAVLATVGGTDKTTIDGADKTAPKKA